MRWVTWCFMWSNKMHTTQKRNKWQCIPVCLEWFYVFGWVVFVLTFILFVGHAVFCISNSKCWLLIAWAHIWIQLMVSFMQVIVLECSFVFFFIMMFFFFDLIKLTKKIQEGNMKQEECLANEYMLHTLNYNVHQFFFVVILCFSTIIMCF